MSTVVDDIPLAFLGAKTLPPSILDEALEEVKGQLLRRYMGTFGSSLSLASGVDLYAVQVESAKRIHTVTHTKPKPGESSRKKESIMFGHTFEELEVMQNNRTSVITGNGYTAKTTDELADMKKDNDPSYLDSLDPYARTNHTQTDVVIYDADGKPQKTLQLKNTKNTKYLLEERYVFGPDAPDVILVPKGFKELHEERLKNILDDPAVDEDKKRLAREILSGNKLQESDTVTRQDSLRPNMAIAKQAAMDAGMRVSENVAKAIMPEIAALTVHGVVWEIKDAQANPATITTWERFKRFFLILWDKVVSAFGLRAKKELALEALNGLLAILKSTFRSFSAFISTIGKAINQVWESLYNYITGKITSFSELVAVILKSITAISLGTLAFTFERFLTSVGIPSIIGGFIAAAFAGLAIVFANRGIDASIKSMMALLSAAELAKARREEIEALCAEALPRIIDGAEELSCLSDRYYAERNIDLSKSFAEMKCAIVHRDAHTVLSSLRSINAAFGASIPWKTIDEFDALMDDDSQVFKL